jgi:FMN-dependent NADH-azoreductase
MTKVLFVKANNRPADQSVSVRMHNSFLAFIPKVLWPLSKWL